MKVTKYFHVVLFILLYKDTLYSVNCFRGSTRSSLNEIKTKTIKNIQMKATVQFFYVMFVSRYFSTKVIDFGACVIETAEPWSDFHLSVVKPKRK